jgi:apolipoprotein N-acyltransferase
MMVMHKKDLEVSEQSKPPRFGILDQLSLIDKAPAAFGCGCLLGLSAPGFDLWWLAWVGLVPLLVLIRSCQSKVQATIVGLIFGMGYQLVSLCWILGLYPLQWLGLSDWIGFQASLWVWLAESGHQALLFAAFALFVAALPMRAGLLPHFARPFFPYLLSVPVLWLFFHWLLGTSDFFLATPVNQLAYSQYRQLELIQVAKWGGSQLVEFLLVLANTALAGFLIERSGWVVPLTSRRDRIAASVGAYVDVGLVAALVAAAFFWGRAEIRAIASDTAVTRPVSADHVPVPVAVIQGNFSIEDERSGATSAAEMIKRYTTLIDKLGVALVVLPEGAADSARPGSLALLDAVKQITTEQKKEALVGTLETTGAGSVNALRLITPQVEKSTLYVKRKLVPFGEYLPLGIVGEMMPPQLKTLLVGKHGGFVPAGALFVPHSIWGNIGASICVEVAYPRLIADEVRSGASILVNVSNLAWFHNSTLNKQVLAASVMRAVENGRFLVLATNTGISAVIDPSGFISSASLPGKRGVLVDTVQFLYKKTPFTRMWWL